MKKAWPIIVAIFAVAAGATTLFQLDSRYAKAEETVRSIQAIEQRLEQKILEDRACQLRRRIWALEDRYWSGDVPPEVKREINHLQVEIDIIYKKIGAE